MNEIQQYENKPCAPRYPGEVYADILRGLENFDSFKRQRPHRSKRYFEKTRLTMMWHLQRLGKAIEKHGQSWSAIYREWGIR